MLIAPLLKLVFNRLVNVLAMFIIPALKMQSVLTQTMEHLAAVLKVIKAMLSSDVLKVSFTIYSGK